MKLFLDGILVVEGKEDVAYLSNYISSEIIPVNGFELCPKTMEYLKDKKVIIMTDPDEAGKQIRQNINKIITNASNVEIDISKCSRDKKKGIAECEIGEVLSKLRPYALDKINKSPHIGLPDLQKIGLINNAKLRSYVCEQLNLGKCNNKQLIKRVNNHKIEIQQMERIVKKYYGN
ncbi:MAG TPA: DUF4093 domain-containing protein [Erysipelotrichaceae bacterium]|nr:DUF4093 domain-containing protein [Erysipelotrichaceae bacterium]